MICRLKTTLDLLSDLPLSVMKKTERESYCPTRSSNYNHTPKYYQWLTCDEDEEEYGDARHAAGRSEVACEYRACACVSSSQGVTGWLVNSWARLMTHGALLTRCLRAGGPASSRHYIKRSDWVTMDQGGRGRWQGIKLVLILFGRTGESGFDGLASEWRMDEPVEAGGRWLLSIWEDR